MSQPKRRSAAPLLLALLGAVLLSACGGTPAAAPAATSAPSADATTSAPAPAASGEVLKIGMEPWIGYGPWWIAQEKGMFAKRGLNVELVNFTQDADINAALAAGQIQAANIATHTTIKLLNKDVQIKLPLLLDASYDADAILAGPTIKSVADLKGKKIAFEEGTTSDLLLTYALSQNGLTKKDVEVVPMAAADAGAALIAGRVDVAVTYEPYISTALGQNKGFSMFYSAKQKPGLISDFLAVREDALAQRPADIKKLMLVWGDAVAFLAQNPDEGHAIIAKAVGSTPEDLKTAFQGVKIYTLDENKQMSASGDLATSYQAVGESLQKMLPDEAKKLPDPKDVLVSTYLP